MDSPNDPPGNAQRKSPGKRKAPSHSGPSKARGLDKDSPDVRISKTMSYILRHHAEAEGVPMREDGYVKVTDLLSNPRLVSQKVDLDKLKELVANDAKQRYDLRSEPSEDDDVWWIRANQGHSMQNVQLTLDPVNSVSDIPTGIAVHGTTTKVWPSIASGGLSRMKRNHIHLAQGVSHDKVISGMRKNCQIFIFIDVAKAIDAGIKFFLSDNGVVLTEGNEHGFIPPELFLRVENRQGVLPGWDEGRLGAVKDVYEAERADNS